MNKICTIYCLLILGSGLALGQGEIRCGERILGEIAEAGESDLYFFRAEEGEAVQLVGTGLDPLFQPRFLILDSSGDVVGEKSIASIRSGSIPLPGAGRYEIEVRDFTGEATGRYVLNLQFTTGRCAEAIECGETLSGSVSDRGEQRAFRFEALAGESVRAVADFHSSSRDAPAMQLFGPDGSQVSENLQGALIGSLLPTEGTYTLVISGFFSFFEMPGEERFSVNLQFATGRCAAPAGSGVVERRIENVLDQSALLFEAPGGSWVHVESQPLDYEEESWSPEILLFGPLGVLDGSVSSPRADFFLSRGGSHTVLISARQAESRSYRVRVDALGEKRFPVSLAAYAAPLLGSALALNEERQEVLAVYALDLSGFGEYEIYGQRIDLRTGLPPADPVRISHVGEDLDPDFDATHPDVAYDPVQREYLVVWSGDGESAGDVEIFARRLDPEGMPLGSVVQLSSTGPDTASPLGAVFPSVAAVPGAGYLVAWTADGSADGRFEVAARRLTSRGQPEGSAFSLGSSSQSRPGLVSVEGEGEYLLAWEKAGGGVTLARIDSLSGALLQELVLADSSDGVGPGPALAYDSLRAQLLGVWRNAEGGVAGAILKREGESLMVRRRLPVTSRGGSNRLAVSFSPGRAEFLVVWEQVLSEGGVEILGQQVDSRTLLRKGSPGFRITGTGAEDRPGFRAGSPDLLALPSDEGFLLVWDANDANRPEAGGNQLFGRYLVGPEQGMSGAIRWMRAGAEHAVPDLSGLSFAGPLSLGPDGAVLLARNGMLSRISPDGELAFSEEIGGAETFSVAFAVADSDGLFLLVADGPESSGRLLSFSSDGQLRWSVEAGAGPFPAPAVSAEGTVYFVSGEGFLKAVSGEGILEWEFSSDSHKLQTSPLILPTGEIVVAGVASQGEGSRIWSFDSDGTLLWSLPLAWRLPQGYGPALASDGTIYLGGAILGALSPDGVLQWSLPLGEESDECRPVVANSGSVLCASGNRILTFNGDGRATGLFFADAEGERFSSYLALGADGAFYAVSSDEVSGRGRIYAVSLDGVVRWKKTLEGHSFLHATPVLSEDGILYVSSDQGDLISLESGSPGAARQGWPMAGGGAGRPGRGKIDSGYRLHFAQFADGAGALSSRIILFNPSESHAVSARLYLRDDEGQPLAVDLNGEQVEGELALEIPPSSVRLLQTDGEGELVVGSARVESDRRLGGVILFGGVVGLAGVGSGSLQKGSYLAPMETDRSGAVNTGVAVMNLEERPVAVDLKLLDPNREVVAVARLEGANALSPGGHLARFVDSFPWDRLVDFDRFRGLLWVQPSGRTSATVIQTRPDRFATMPVVPLIDRDWARLEESLVGDLSARQGPFQLNFAQFADGGGLKSQLLLFNSDPDQAVEAEIRVRDDSGELLEVDLNGEQTSGLLFLTVPPLSIRIVESDGAGPVNAGSAVVRSYRPLSGVIVFEGPVGLAGVGSGRELVQGFLAPMETVRRAGVNTGIAVVNLGDHSAELSLELCDLQGQRVAGARLSSEELPAGGHRALFVDQFEWDVQVDFSEFSGVLKVSSDQSVAATVIQTRPGQFATMPVIPFAP